MRSRLLLLLGLAIAFPTLALAQARPGVRAVAVIVSIHADSSGRAIQNGKPLNATALDRMLTDLRPQLGATIWFSWSGGPGQSRTARQDTLLRRLRASGVRVELRTDSTMYSRVIRP